MPEQPQARKQISAETGSCYHLECICGLKINTRARIFQCPNCGRHGEIQAADYRSKPLEPTITGKMEAEDREKGLTAA